MLPPLRLRQRGIDIAKHLQVARQDLPKRHATALTRTAFAVAQAEQQEMRRVFDRPTPFTLRSLKVETATARDLTAVVYFKQTRATSDQHYLEPQVAGGQRPFKRFEQRLQRIGVLPRGMYAVPGSGARVDKYGNMSSGQLVQILSQLRAFSEAGFDAHPTASKRSRRSVKRAGVYFAGRPGGGRLPLGVWQKKGNKIVPVLVFVNAPQYRARFAFYDIGHRIAAARFPIEFERAVREAWQRARARAQLPRAA